MIKVSVMYPYAASVRFDHHYYRDKHLPLIKARMGEALQRYTVDKGISDGKPNGSPIYVAACHLFFESLEAYRAAMDPHRAEILRDIPNYTDTPPVIQISEVVVA